MLRAAPLPRTRRRPRRVEGRCAFKRFGGIKLQDIIGPLNANYK